MFAATIDEEKLERALDLVHRLHLEKSYDLAIRIADNHRKLADLVEDAKERRFAPEEEEEEDYDDDEEDGQSPGSGRTFIDRLSSSRQISPEAGAVPKLKRPVGHSGLNGKRQRVV